MIDPLPVEGIHDPGPDLRGSILLIDDHPDVLRWLERLFQRDGWKTDAATSGESALEIVRAEAPDVIVQDLRMPGLDGLDLLRTIRRTDPDVAVIIATGHGDISTAVEAMQVGAESFLLKPLDVRQLLDLAESAREKVELRRQKRHQILAPPPTGLESLGQSPAMQDLARQIMLVAATDTTVLIQGETGTGKSWIANQIHELSQRQGGPFIEVNCGGLSSVFLNSELFGHEKGAFTGASAEKRGLLEVADKGTLFLDEIGDLDPEVQPKILTVLETRRFRRLGGVEQRVADVRLIAATHRPLLQDVEAGRFREDLYYRISVLPLKLPPLRERSGADLVEVLFLHLRQVRERVGSGPSRISTEALTILVRQPWLGNLRELRNVLERCLISYPHAEELLPEHLPPHMLDPVPTRAPAEAEAVLPLEEVERQHIERVLRHYGMNRTRAARALGIGRRTLYDKIRRYGLE